MGLLDFLKQHDINQGVKDYRNAPEAILLDVRTPEEYREGHIPGSKNVPLQTIEQVTSVAKGKDTALYVYCQSGVRSRQATGMLKQMGYARVNNIGGFAAYSGEVERS